MQEHDATVDAAMRVARFIREGGNLPELIGRLCDTAPRQVIRAVTDTETGEQPVVRRVIGGAVSPNRGMVAALAEMSTVSPSDSGGVS